MIMKKLNRVAELCRMRINTKQTEATEIGKSQKDIFRTETGGTDMEQMQQFKSFESVVIDEGTNEKDKNSGIALKKDAFNRREVLSKNLKLDLKKRVGKTGVVPVEITVVLYG